MNLYRWPLVCCLSPLLFAFVSEAAEPPTMAPATGGPDVWVLKTGATKT